MHCVAYCTANAGVDPLALRPDQLAQTWPLSLDLLRARRVSDTKRERKRLLAKKLFGAWTSDAQRYRPRSHWLLDGAYGRVLVWEPYGLPPLCRSQAYSRIGGHVGHVGGGLNHPSRGGIPPSGRRRLPSPLPPLHSPAGAHVIWPRAAAPARSGAVAGARNNTFSRSPCLAWPVAAVSSWAGGR